MRFVAVGIVRRSREKRRSRAWRFEKILIMFEGHRWIEQDRFGNKIYLTEERWEHINNSMNHPEMTDYENELRETIRFGTRKQEAISFQKYRYSKKFDDLTANNTHIVAIVIFRFSEDLSPNNFIVTAYQKKVWWIYERTHF